MKTRVGNSIFCEDVRPELGNKISLMGIYASDILITAPPPFTFPKFGIVAWIIVDKDDVPKKFTIRILIPPNRTELARIDVEGEPALTTDPDEFSKHVLVRMVIPITNLVLSDDGYLEVMVDVEGEETFRAGRLRVRFNVTPEEAGLPAA